MIQVPFTTLLMMAVRDPRQAARMVIDARLPDIELWWMLVLGAVLSVLPTYAFLIFGEVPDDAFAEMMQQAFPFPPMVAAVLQWGQAVIGVFVVHWVGAAFRATASRHDILGVLAVLQLLSLVLAYAIVLLGLILPILTAFALLIFVCWWLFAITMFVDEAYGFASPFKTALILAGAFIATLICSSIALSVVGGILFGIVGAR